MDNRLFRKIVVQQIEAIVEQEPSSESLIKLLQIAKPGFLEADLSNERIRESAYRAVKLLIHPDKHPSDCSGAVGPLFQAVQSFYDNCQAQGFLKRKSVSGGSPTSAKFPFQFHVKDQWSYLDVINPVMSSSVTDPGLIARSIAYKCINFRGAIAHGKRTDLSFSIEQMLEPAFAKNKSVKGVFDGLGGTKVLSNTDAIKEELMERGPVVSTSFRLCQAFLNACQHSSSFAASQINRAHPLVIVGWKLSAFGEMWLARSIDAGANDIPIAFGQFSIDDECLAPISSFEQLPWQDETKAFDIYMGDAKWYSWENIETYVDHTRLQALAKVLGGSFATSFGTTKIVVRDEKKIAHSRWAYITDISWSEEKKSWKVNATFAK